MQRLIWTAASLMTLMLIWTACSKKNSGNNNTNSNMTLMTQAVWKYDTSGFDLTGDGKIDFADTLLEPCFKDNTYQFKKDSTVVVDEGATKCNSADPQTATYSWSITSGTPAILRSDADSILANGVTVQTLNSTQLVVYKDTAILGISLRYILSMKH
jgi:hypothetical protein